MTTKLEWKNFNKVPLLGFNPQDTPIGPGQTLLAALGNAQGQTDVLKERVRILEIFAQGTLLLDVSGVVGEYQMTREESLNPGIVFFNNDPVSTLTGIRLYDAVDNPGTYMLLYCSNEGSSTVFKSGTELPVSTTTMQNAMLTEVWYGYTAAQEILIEKLQAADHGDINVESDYLTWTIKPNVVSASKLTQAVRDDIAARQLSSEKGQALGYAPLDINTKIPTEFLPTSIVGATKFKGFFDGNTGIVTSSDLAINGLPIPAASPANEGWYFITQVAGAYVLDGITPWNVGDVAISYAIAWGQIDNTDSVISVNGQTGPVLLATGDIPSILNNRYVTDADLVVLSNTSGANSGDETTATIKTKLGITTLSGSNTGDETTATIKSKLGITTLSGSNTGDQTSIVGISGTIAEFNTACTDASFATGGGTATGSNTGDQTSIVGISGTIAQFNTACSDADFATGGGNVTGNSSGNNTGDETTATIKSKLGITTLSGSNTGDQTSIVGISGTIAQFNTACSDADFATGGGTATGTNTGDQTSIVGISGTIAQFNTACSDADFATGGGSATGANTGDETTATIKSKLGITTLSGSNTGDQTSIVGIAGTIAQFNAACTDADFATGGGSATGTNTGDQSSIVGISGTIAQFNTACTDADFATGGGTATGANTGDETTATIKSKLGITTLSGSNTGDQTSIVGITGTIAQFNTACTDADFAPVASPALTGTPTAPTAAANTNTTQIATTAFVAQQDDKATSQSTPANPATTTSAAGVMMGLAGSITPVRSGKVLVTISGDMDNSSTGDSVTAQIRTGTGAAPANGAALTGTARGANVQATNPTVTLSAPVVRVPFSVQAVMTGLTLNTAVWLDLGVSAQGGGTARVRNISISAVEL